MYLSHFYGRSFLLFANFFLDKTKEELDGFFDFEVRLTSQGSSHNIYSIKFNVVSVGISIPPNRLRVFLQILKSGVAMSRQNFFGIFRVVYFDFLFCQRVV